MSYARLPPKRTSLAIAAAFALGGCGGGGAAAPAPVVPAPPVTPAPIPTTVLSGVAVDGYLSGATIFIDTNNNNTLDAGEASAVTNAAGAYTLTYPGAPTDLNGKRLRALGGTDASTRHAFTHAMSALIADAAGKPFAPVSPLSTIVDAMVLSGAAPNVTQARDTLAKMLGLTSAAVLDKDPLTQVLAEPTLLQKMVAIQKSIEVMASADRAAAEPNNAAAVTRAASAFGAEVARQAALPPAGALPSVGEMIKVSAASQRRFFANQAAVAASAALAADVANLTEAALAASVGQMLQTTPGLSGAALLAGLSTVVDPRLANLEGLQNNAVGAAVQMNAAPPAPGLPATRLEVVARNSGADLALQALVQLTQPMTSIPAPSATPNPLLATILQSLAQIGAGPGGQPPTAAPTAPPTAPPTAAPTAFPTAPPTAAPTAPPTAAPTAVPTAVPTAPPTMPPTAPPINYPNA